MIYFYVCADLQVTFLGTGTSQGIPLIGCPCEVCKSLDTKDKRLRSSVLVQTEGKNFIIDTGPDFRQQMLRTPISRIDAILFTHSHKDHISGFDDIRAYNYIQKENIDVYLEEDVMKAMRRDFFYMFEDFKYPGVPEADFHIIDENIFKIQNIPIIPIRVFHHKMPVLGFRIGDFSYITDANKISDHEIAKMKGSKVLVLNALRRDSHISHFSLSEAVEMAKKIDPEKAYFTHISHQLGLHQEVNNELPLNMALAWDGLTIEI